MWSSMLTDSLSTRLQRQHPEWVIYAGNLKTENAMMSSSTQLTLRSLLWGYAELTRDSVPPTSLRFADFFMQDDTPDALLIVGDEGFKVYTSLGRFLGAWERVPVILSMASDSLSTHLWRPDSLFYDQMVPIDDYRPMVSPIEFSGVVAPSTVEQNLTLIRSLIPDLKELIWVDTDSYISQKNRLEVERLMPQLLPEVAYASMKSTLNTTDSIYQVMLQPAPGRVFLTHSWNIDGMLSQYTPRQLDSLFTHVSTVPIFSLTRRDFNRDNYYVGGYYYDMPEVIDRTIDLVDRAVAGDSLNRIPFKSLQTGHIVLNQTALKRYKLMSEARRLENVVYQHIPPSFYRAHETAILITLLFLSLLTAFLLIAWARMRHNHRLRGDNERYKRRYNRLQAIYDTGNIDFTLYDGQGKRIKRIFENAPDDDGVAQGTSAFHLSDNLFDSPHLTDLQKHKLLERQTVNCEIITANPSGHADSALPAKMHYQAIIKPLNGKTYHTASFIAITINLTSMMQERQERKRYERIFQFASDSSQIGVVFYDIHTAAGMATDSWCATMNEPFISGIFPGYENVVPEDREVLLAYRQRVRNGELPEPLYREIQVRSNDGKTHWVRQHIYVAHDSTRLIELSMNIDQQKRNEQELEQARLHAEQSNVETQTFLEEISHEVRTPLNSIVGFSTILAELDDEERKQAFAPIIHKNIRLLNELLSNILDLSALDAGSVHFRKEWFSVPEMFRKWEEQIRNNMYGKWLYTTINLPDSIDECLIHTDLKYLTMLLSNLVSNAVKFTPDGGTITLTYYQHSERKSYCFSISDTGCGISKENQQHIFDRFYKADSFVQGSGLGLSICRSIAEHLGGKIEVESVEGEGCTFRIELPEWPQTKQ
jgi:signal transduction histidine kinase